MTYRSQLLTMLTSSSTPLTVGIDVVSWRRGRGRAEGKRKPADSGERAGFVRRCELLAAGEGEREGQLIPSERRVDEASTLHRSHVAYELPWWSRFWIQPPGHQKVSAPVAVVVDVPPLRTTELRVKDADSALASPAPCLELAPNELHKPSGSPSAVSASSRSMPGSVSSSRREPSRVASRSGRRRRTRWRATTSRGRSASW